MSAPVDPQLAADLRDAGIDGFTAVSRETLADYADWIGGNACNAPGCPACARVWAYMAGRLAACVEGLLGVIAAADLPVGGRHEARDPYAADHQENPQ